MNFDGESICDYAAQLVRGIVEGCITIIDILSKVTIQDYGADVKPMITAAAATIATLLVVIELCTHAMGFHFDDINDAVRFLFKVIVYKIIIENSGKIVDLVYGLFINDTAWQNLKSGLTTVQHRFEIGSAAMVSVFNTLDDDWAMGLKKFFFALLFLGFAVVMGVILIKILAAMAGLLFELAINIAVAPVPVATLVNSQSRQIGISFIKNFAGNCLTLSMYSICFAIYGALCHDLSSVLYGNAFPETTAGEAWSVIAGLVIGVVLLSTAVNNVSNMMSKVLS